MTELLSIVPVVPLASASASRLLLGDLCCANELPRTDDFQIYIASLGTTSATHGHVLNFLLLICNGIFYEFQAY